jgi:hypothetical protein
MHAGDIFLNSCIVHEDEAIWRHEETRLLFSLHLSHVASGNQRESQWGIFMGLG